ncbi:MAG: N-acetyltransferase family protein [Bacteroidales bacterium]|nr:N-acetyltransferase family protein [Bacteroidales bacterium]
MNIELTELRESDLPIVQDIYNHYILNSTATFHTQEISIDELKEAIYIKHNKYISHLIKFEGETCGYCYLAPYKKRQAYNRTAEVTLYLKPGYAGKGIGKIVLEQIEHIAVRVNIKVLLGIITGDNTASITLFERCGYEKCAHFKQVGEKFGKILDVVGYQKILG